MTRSRQSKTAGLAPGIINRLGRIQMAWRFILVSLLVFLASIIWLSQTSTLVSLGYEINRIDKKVQTLDREAEQLQAEIAQYETLSRIEDEAKTKLGMQKAKNIVYVKVPAAVSQAQTNSAPTSSVAGNFWWRELLEMLPKSPTKSER